MGKTKQTNEDQGIDQRIGLNRQLAEYDYMKIRQNTDLNQEAKRRLLRKKYQEHLKEHQQLVEERGRLRGEAQENIESKVFDLPRSKDPSLRLQEQLAFRDAADRVRRAASPEDLEQLLGVAKISGDAILRHAVFVSAHHRGTKGVLGRIFEDDPGRTADYQTFVERQSQEAASQELAENIFDV